MTLLHFCASVWKRGSMLTNQLQLVLLLLTIPTVHLRTLRDSDNLPSDGRLVNANNTDWESYKNQTVAPHICATMYNPKLPVSRNHRCTTRYEEKAAPGFPARWFEANCHCKLTKRNPGGICERSRMPVTVLRPASNVSINGRTRTLLEEFTQLRYVDCVSLLPLLHLRPVALTATQLRLLGRQVRSPIFEPMECGRRPPLSPPWAAFHLSQAPDRIPELVPEARCPCSNQVPVQLPLGILRRVNAEGWVRSVYDVTTVSCATLSEYT